MADFDITKPVDALKIGDIPQWFRDVQIVLKDLIQREHATVGGTLAAITGAEHKSGSAKAYVQDAAPTKRPDTSTNLGADDAGRIWFDSDDDYLMHIHDGTNWNTTIETMINAMDGLNLAEDFAIGTDKFTVAAVNGNTAIGGNATIGGTLAVTGITTLGDGSKLASAAAPDADAEIANKKYVDDRIKGWFYARDEKSQGTSAGDSTTSWAARTLNTEKYNSITGASLAADQITLPVGTYRVSARAPSWGDAGRSQIRLKSISGTAIEEYGSSSISWISGETYPFKDDSLLTAFIVLDAITVLELQHKAQFVEADVGLGRNANHGTEVYAEIEIWKLV